MNILFSTLKTKMKNSPRGIYILFYTQMWELFGRFAITSLLILYLTKDFQLTDAMAFSIYSTFIALIFAAPIVGGYLADRYLGSRHAVILGASVMAIGNLLLTIPNESIAFLGLSTIAMGSGFFLPSIPPLISAIYESDEKKRDAGFTLYYLATNIGALLGPILCGFVSLHFGFSYAFFISSLGMLSGVIVFIIGNKSLVDFDRKPKITLTKPHEFFILYSLTACLIPLFFVVMMKHLTGIFMTGAGVITAGLLAAIYYRSNPKERFQLLFILFGIVCVIIFETFLGQGGTTLNLFIDRLVDKKAFGITLPTSFFYALDPTFMLLVGPFIAMLWTTLAKRNQEPSVTFKFGTALVTLGLGFLLFSLAATQAKISGQSSSFFVVLAYFLFPIAELCIIPISLSLVTRIAPRGCDGILVAIWMLSSAAAGYFTGLVSQFGKIEFSINSLLQAKMAAGIYQHLFFVNAGTLVITGILILTLGFVLYRKPLKTRG